jgi:enoyl-CoA hydratase/carnithine racemase
MSDPVTVSIEGNVGIIELSRPEKFNCLSLEVHECIAAARTEFEANRDVRAILIRAQGKHFCTGADLIEVKEKLYDPVKLEFFLKFGMTSLRKLEQSPLPVIVAVQGLCLAGGIELMLSADICFAAETAQFGDQHAQFGLIPGWGGSQRLPRIIGQRRALDLMFSARWLKADEAKEAGLVNYIVPAVDLHQTAQEYCQTIATRSRPGISEMKRLAREGADMSIDQQMRLELNAAARALPSADAAEGLDAFENRRIPDFKQ